MFQTMQLLKQHTLWKENKSTPQGAYVDGVWEEGEATYSYTTFEGFAEPYVRASESDVISQGVLSTEMFRIYTSTDLKTHNDLKGTARNADVIYIDDPALETSKGFVIFDKESWRTNSGMTLITEDYGYYIAVRQEKFQEMIS